MTFMAGPIIIYHQRLSEYFDEKPLYLDGGDNPNFRKIVELPWQLRKAKMFRKLKKILTNHDFFLCLSNINRYEIWKHWESIPQEKRDMVASYKDAITRWEMELGKTKKYELSINELEHFFLVSGKIEESSSLAELSFELAVKLYSENDFTLAIRKNNLATAYYNMKRFLEAESLYLQVLPLYMSEYGTSQEEYWIIQINLGTCYIRLDKIEKAERLLRNSCQGTRLNLGPHNLVTLTAINNLAEVEWYKGNFYKARKLYEEAIIGRSKILGNNHPLTAECQMNRDFLVLNFINRPFNVAANNLVLLLRSNGLFTQAEKMKKLYNL